jgi:hypothetical protein
VAASAHAFARIPAYRLGLLEPSEALAVREHLRTCEECRETFEPFRALSDEEERRPGHLPIALITRWEQFAPLLSNDERECLEEHFASCPRCTEGRAFARLIPEMPRLEAAPARRAWLGFGTGLAAVLVAAAILVLRQPSPTPLVKSPAPAAAPVPLPTVGMVLRAPLLTLAGIDRGGAGLVVRVPKGATVLPIRVPPLLGVGPDARIRVRVEGPGGVEFGRTELAHKKLFGTSTTPSLEAQAPGGPLPEGMYHVLVTSNVPNPQAPRGFEGAEYRFDLRTGAAE